MEIDPTKDKSLIEELAQPAANLLNHHLSVAKVWYPHQLVPYDLAQTFPSDYKWSPDEYPLDPAIRSAIYINLLTEDNLPYYTNTILTSIKGDHPFKEWGRRWTAEEARHSEVIRSWVHATHAIDPILLEDSRILQMGKGEVPNPSSFAELLIYTSLQELATQIAHRNTGKLLDHERRGKLVMTTVAGDEGLHHKFYSSLAKEAFVVDPSTMVIAALNQVKGFKMPGTGIPAFEIHAKSIAEAKIYDPDQFLNSVVKPTLQSWGIDSVDNLTPEADKAYVKLNNHIELLGRAILRQQ